MRFFQAQNAIFILALFFLSCTPQKQSQKSKIILWHWMNDREEALEELAQQYQQESGIEVECKLFFPPDIYAQKVIAAARADNLPEIFGILGEKKTMASFIKAGHLLNLTPAMEKNESAWEERFYPQTLAVAGFLPRNSYGVPEGIYGVPIDTTMMQFVYNKPLMRKGGFDPDVPPHTLREFLSYAQTIKKKTGVDGFVCGWGEGWLLNALATEWAFNLMGENKFFRTIKGDVPYTDREWIEVFSLFATLRDSGILSSNITTMINKESEDRFSKGKAAFSFNGSWAVNVYEQLAPQLDYAFFSLPRVGEKFPVRVWGGAGSFFMVNSHSPLRQEAVKFLQWITEKEQQIFLVHETNNLPAIKGCEEELPPLLLPLLDELERLTHPNVWPYNEDSRVLEKMNTGLQQIVMGLKSPREIAEGIQEVKKRILSQPR